MKNSIISLAGFLIAVSGTAVPVRAVTSITTCGFVISSPGNYSLDTDLAACPFDGIKITASGVSLKLNGHTITGVARCCFAGIAINRLSPPNIYPSGRLNHVAVEGPGLIQTFGSGIAVIQTDYAQIALVTAAHNLDGIDVVDSTFVTVGSNSAVANSYLGIFLGAVGNSVVQFNDVSGNYAGINLDRGGANNGTSFANTLHNNTVNANLGRVSFGLFGNGIEAGAGSTASRIYSNVTNGNTGAGILVDSGSTGNQIFSNSSSVGNGTFDLDDDNTSCDSNVWSSNVYFTLNQPCALHH